MAVFTRITQDELQQWLAGRDCGDLLSFEGIESGIENTNYFVNTSADRYVLTIFEKLTEQELPFYLELMGHLARKKLPVPGPVAGPQGALFSTLKGKPATLVNCLRGRSVVHPNVAQCAAIGDFCARAHLAVSDFEGKLPNPRGLSWIAQVQTDLQIHLPAKLRDLLGDEIAYQQTTSKMASHMALPTGAVHADLFRDNALMVDNALGGVIDFYFAGVDTFLFDLAVTANDWCIHLETGELDPSRLKAMLDAYQLVRPLTPEEREHWQDALRAAALRFWTSRLFDFYMPREAEVLNVKDPSHFERVLLARRAGLPFLL
ncbi:MAG TPA: homoserine kinase [Limnobacter sp.]|nr:homoserine kinase [Limnobacter sp.]